MRAHHREFRRRVLLAVRERAEREGWASNEVLSDLVRLALNGPHRVTAGATEEQHGFRPLPRCGLVVSNDRIDGLREEDVE